VLASRSWSPRAGAILAAPAGEVLVIGGSNATAPAAAPAPAGGSGLAPPAPAPGAAPDVWASDDLVHWASRTPDAGWGARAANALASASGGASAGSAALLVLGGYRDVNTSRPEGTLDPVATLTLLGDVWTAAADGASWSRATGAAAFPPR
jgi:hypothetical protein